MRIFLCGSISVREIPSEVSQLVLGLSLEKHEFLLGDAPGADSAFQNLLFQNGAESVQVFHSGNSLRNNVGRWKTRFVDSGLKGGHAMHAAKDRVMASESDIGIMVWDGLSIGTITNTVTMLRDGKSCHFYDSNKKRLSELGELSELSPLETEYVAEFAEMRKRLAKYDKRDRRLHDEESADGLLF
jgi:hypothetical protein